MAPENNLSLGGYLRQERERRGITIEQVASATKISVKLLHSLESDHYNELPAKPFIRGFVMSYARFIGLNGKEILTQFDSFIDSKAKDRPNRDSGHSGYAFEKKETEQSRVFLWIIMGSFIVFGGIAYVVFKPKLKHQRGSHVEKLREAHPSFTPEFSPGPSGDVLVQPVVQSSGEPAATSVPSAAAPAVTAPVATSVPSPTPEPATPKPTPKPATPKPEPSPSAPPVAQGSKTYPRPNTTPNPNDPLNTGKELKTSEVKHKVVVKATKGSVWVRYRSDDRPSMKFILRKDTVLVIRATHTIVFQVSHPENVVLSHNNTGYRGLNPKKDGVLRQNDPTFVFPQQEAETIQEPFPGERPISNASVPAPWTPNPVSTPAE